MSETRILIRLLRMYFPRNWEFGSALSKLPNGGAGGGGTPPPLGTPLMLRTVDWELLTDVLRQPVSPIFKGVFILLASALKMGLSDCLET
jgi:hypothetical protein